MNRVCGSGPRCPFALLEYSGPLVRALGAVAPRRYGKDRSGRSSASGSATIGRPRSCGRCRRARRPSTTTPSSRCSARSSSAASSRRAPRTRLASRTIIARHPEILTREIKRPLFVLGLAAHRHHAAAAAPVAARGRALPPLLGGLPAVPRNSTRLQGRQSTAASPRPSARSRRSNGSAPSSTRSIPSRPRTRRSATTSSAPTSSCRRASISATCRATGTGGTPLRTPTSIRMHKRQLQVLQWLDRRQHWVLKCPNHLSGIRQLLDTYPDARIVYTHRDPREDHRLPVQPHRGDLEHDVGRGRSRPGGGVRARHGAALPGGRARRAADDPARPDHARRVRRARRRSRRQGADRLRPLRLSARSRAQGENDAPGSRAIRATSTACTAISSATSG